MKLTALIDALSDPGAYPYPVEAVEVRQTHISAVFLAGPFAYKIKKPVNLGFLDFSTLAKRRHFCEEEVRLNRRLAPTVYLGVVPVNCSGSGVTVEGPGEAVEWAVKMERLPEEATLARRLQRGEVNVELVQGLARKVASFHALADRSEAITDFGRWEVVARNTKENLDSVVYQVGTTVSPAVLERLRSLTEAALTHLRPLMESRAERGVPRDTHGDLHLDHIYLFPDRKPPADLVLIDCIEFNERFRFADPVSDMAFLVMDLRFQGRHDLARVFAEEYFQASGDEEGPALLPFYTAYRAAVRGKVEGLELLEKEIPQGERDAALMRARAHWLLALGELEPPGRRPCLVLIGGLPGSGKSTLAKGLSEGATLCLIRSDVVRKELAGLDAQVSARFAYNEGIYTPAWTERTYAECLRRAERLLFEGQRVLVDASFGEAKHRRAFGELAVRLGVPLVFLLCQASHEEIRQRLGVRQGDASDADWFIYQQAAAHWEEPRPVTHGLLSLVPTDGTKADALARALASLDDASLFDCARPI
jgi:aminoglycoside phosphotransferase family enzyme/predicted kinase